ncbi:MAG TPA: pyruvate kinase [Chitinophagaceae bacterium]|nr:pyruvate kinase [Chitinophagaceae bacterium]
MQVVAEKPVTLRQAISKIISEMHSVVNSRSAELLLLHERQFQSARNLLHYLILRSKDIRNLQDELHVAGLSSLASSESHTLRQLQAILQRLGEHIDPREISTCDYYFGREMIRSNSHLLFGEKADDEIPYLMVTFDTQFASDYQLIKKLLQSGMNIARINCAHDDQEAWLNMIDLVRLASDRTGLPCKIYMDLGGPKMRTVIRENGKLVDKISLFEKQEILMVDDVVSDPAENIVVGCEEHGLIKQLKKGNRILFDDGIIEATVLEKHRTGVRLRIERVSDRKQLLRAGKGMNFPDTELRLPPLTPYDISVLPFVAEHADLVGYSFVRNAGDLENLQKLLSVYNKRPSIIIKIETSDAVKNLPALIMQGMRDKVFGVMIARGDLAVEIGFERLSEIQEEIMWICEAAHVPVIWATQVLETLNKSGIATRSEITDASYAALAECVMINKGNYVLKVIKTLNDILRRSGGHHIKKRYTFRSMQIALNYLGNS